MRRKTKELRKKILRTHRKTKPGASPGTLVPLPESLPTKIFLIAYDKDNLTEKEITQARQIKEYLGKWENVWIHVSGLKNIDILKQLGDLFSLHPLALEDVVHVHQRPKVDEYENNLFITTRMATRHGEDLDLEQVSLFLGDRYVLSFQESSGDGFEPVRERIRKGKGRIRLSKPDYLTYALLDTVVDSYFPVLEEYSDKLDAVEDEVILNPHRNLVARIHHIKRDMFLIRRAIWPQRDALNTLSKETRRVADETRVFLRDCHDHVAQILDILESLRERSTGLTDIYLSSLSNKMNEVMKVLTIIATIFMPLGVIAGVYGMNFNTEKSPWNMPELGWQFGYPFALILMALVAGSLFIYFYRKGWLNSGEVIEKNNGNTNS